MIFLFPRWDMLILLEGKQTPQPGGWFWKILIWGWHTFDFTWDEKNAKISLVLQRIGNPTGRILLFYCIFFIFSVCLNNDQQKHKVMFKIQVFFLIAALWIVLF